MADDPRIFIDAEFSDLTDLRLLSIGLVSENGEEFYGELAGVSFNTCNKFILSTVVPLLGQQPGAIHTKAQLRDKLSEWLVLVRGVHETLVVSYDYYGDYVLLVEALGGETPSWLRGDNIGDRLSAEASAEFWRSSKLPQHHALHDARALRHAYQAWQVGK